VHKFFQWVLTLTYNNYEKVYTKLSNGFIIFLHSCDEDKILNLEPVNNISNDASYSSPSLIQLSVNGMYNAAQIGQYNSTNPNGGRGYVWGAAFVQQGDNRVSQPCWFLPNYISVYLRSKYG
jgi:hypothetical protein